MRNIATWLRVFVLAAIACTPACASIVSKSDYPVTISTSPTQADIVVIDEEGTEVFRGTTPTALTLAAGDGYFSAATYKVEITKEGYESQVMTIEASLDGWYYSNILLGGVVIGMLVVDPYTGAMWKLPDIHTASLAQAAPAEPVADEPAAGDAPAEAEGAADEGEPVSLRILLIDEVPDHLRGELVEIRPAG